MRWEGLMIGAWAVMNIVSSPACSVGDEEDLVGAAVAEREGAATASPGEEAPEVDELPELPIAGPGGAVPGPPGKCCYVRCGTHVRYQKIPWEVEGSCDAEGWEFCAEFYVAKLVDAAWLRC